MNTCIFTRAGDHHRQGFYFMSIDISVAALNTNEKLALMERLWEALSQRPADVPSPKWHGDVLAERIAAVRDGRSKFIDWDEAKERLRARPA
jgi:putative addiction module component (TIGR02574 family)